MKVPALKIRSFTPADQKPVIALWRRCGLVRPTNNPHKDIRRKLAVNSEMFLVSVEDGQIVAAVMAGYEGHRGWINYLAVAPEKQRRGVARRMMNTVEKMLRKHRCAKINLQIRTTNRKVIAFYKRIGYSIDAVVSMGKRLVFDSPLPDPC